MAERERTVVGFGHLVPPAAREAESADPVDPEGPAPAEGEVTAIYVHGDHAREGVGSALLEHLQRVARQQGLDALALTSSLNAVGFYERHGYERVREATHETTREAELDVVVMRKRLGDEAGSE